MYLSSIYNLIMSSLLSYGKYFIYYLIKIVACAFWHCRMKHFRILDMSRLVDLFVII